MTRGRMKTSLALLAGTLIAATYNIVSRAMGLLPTWQVSAVLWSAVAIFWMVSVRLDIPDRAVRLKMMSGAVLILMLFILLPLISLSISFSVGDGNRARARRVMGVLWCIAALLILLVMMNDYHGAVIRIEYVAGEEMSSAGPAYYIIVLWSFALVLSSFIVMLWRCRLTASRRYFYIPVAVDSVGVLLYLLYYLNGGTSPKIHGVSLYNIQEVYELLFIGLWESCMLIGIIPTVSLMRDREWIKDAILGAVRDEAAELKALCGDLDSADDGYEFRDLLTRCACIGAYIKRRANLELISDERGYLKSTELSLAIRESFEYLSLSGISAGLEETGSVEAPALLILYAYEIFNMCAKQSLSACYVKLSARETYDALGFAMTIETDGNVEALHGLKDAELLKLLNATLSVHEEDGTVYTELKADYPKRSGILYSLRLMSKMPQNMSYGLKGIAEYLSLEKEALDAKIRIHDSIGRCLLITKLYILKGGETGTFGQSGGEVSREAVSLEWDKVIKEISGGDASRWDILERAEALGVKVRLTGELPKEEHLKDIVDTAVTVHITNMLRHTGYRTALIRTGSFGSVYIMELTQDGDESDYEIRETGGLSNLRRQVESAGGVMEVSGRRGFLLMLTLPKEMTAG